VQLRILLKQVVEVGAKICVSARLLVLLFVLSERELQARQSECQRTFG